jgi:uncharacterized protein (DUF433 family)
VAHLQYPHIEQQAGGAPLISGTLTKVVEIVLDRLAHDWGPDEIQRQHPHLTLAQIHSALAFYYDHQEEMDRDIQRRIQNVEEIQRRLGPSTLRARLRAAGQTP